MRMDSSSTPKDGNARRPSLSPRDRSAARRACSADQRARRPRQSWPAHCGSWRAVVLSSAATEGSVQAVLPLDHHRLKLTTALYFTPAAVRFSRKIHPDVEMDADAQTMTMARRYSPKPFANSNTPARLSGLMNQFGCSNACAERRLSVPSYSARPVMTPSTVPHGARSDRQLTRKCSDRARRPRRSPRFPIVRRGRSWPRR